MNATFWDEKYANSDYIYGTEPNAYLRSQAFRMAPGARALAIADGEGRNGVWLAAQGLDVLSVDQSATGMAKAERLARRQGVRLRTVVADLLRWNWPVEAFDLVAAIFAHFPPAERSFVHSRCVAALRPGGLLVLEGFHKRQLGKGTGGPPVAEMLLDAGELRQDFRELEILELLERTVRLSEGSHHRGDGEVVRLLARKT